MGRSMGQWGGWTEIARGVVPEFKMSTRARADVKRGRLSINSGKPGCCRGGGGGGVNKGNMWVHGLMWKAGRGHGVQVGAGCGEKIKVISRTQEFREVDVFTRVKDLMRGVGGSGTSSMVPRGERSGKGKRRSGWQDFASPKSGMEKENRGIWGGGVIG